MSRTIDSIIKEWYSKPRRMGCVSATNWFIKRKPEFHPTRLTRFTSDGEIYEHVVAQHKSVIIDLASYADKPRI